MRSFTPQGVLTQSEFVGDVQDLGYNSAWGSFAAAVQEGFLDSPTTGLALQEYYTPEAGAPISKEDYQKSPDFRKAIPWTDDMTEDRAAYLASWYDQREIRRRRMANSSDAIAQFSGYLVGSVPDVTNFIPFVGWGGKAAQAAGTAAKMSRMAAAGKYLVSASQGTIKSRMAAGALDAAVGSGIVLTATAGYRAEFGADTSLGSILSEVAGAAFIGAAFGGAAGGISKYRQASLKRKYGKDGIAALEEAVVSLAEDGEVRIPKELSARIEAVGKSENPVFSEGLLRRTVETDTAARPMDAGTPTLGEFEDFLRGQVLSKDSELNARYTEAKTAFEEAQAAVEEIEGPLAARTVSDAVDLLDGPSAERLRQIEQDLAAKPSRKVRQDLEAERDLILDNIGRDQIGRAENDFRIGPEKRAKQARKKLATARRHFASIQRETNDRARADLEVNKTTYQPRSSVAQAVDEPMLPRIREVEGKIGRPAEQGDMLKSEYGIDSADDVDVEIFRDMKARDELSAEDLRAVEEVEEIERRTAAYADGLFAAAKCEITR